MKYKVGIVLFLLVAAISANGAGIRDKKNELPNIVVLLLDDIGYGDLSSYGHPIIRTPNMDRLAKEGIRFTSFVTAASCAPSRTQLMLGRYMPRVDFGGTLDPYPGGTGKGGIPESETTLAQGLKKAGYITGMAGKWHLGYQPGFLPVNKGFDQWLGLPYSNDFRKPWVQTDVPLGLFRDTTMIEYPVNQNMLTARYTQEAVEFINKNSKKEQPFFFYLAYNMAHLPISTTEEFQGRSKAGLYGDVMEELDWSVGQILQALEDNGAANNTVVFLASDNGPWMDAPARMFSKEHNEPWHQGTAGLLRGSKGSSYEGGSRVPAMIRWPDKIPAGRVSCELVAMPDIYYTLLEIGNAKLPDLVLDGYDLRPFLYGETDKSPRNKYAYILGNLQAMRIGDWKLRLATGEPELYNLQLDPSERYNRANEKFEIVYQIYAEMLRFADELGIQVSESNVRIK